MNRTLDGDCPSAEQLACLVEGALDHDEVAAVLDHTGHCDACCDILASLARGHARDQAHDEVRPTRGAVLDRYVLLEPLGRGAMGVVWSAHDPGLERKIAVKLVAADAFGGASSDAGKRLQREAQTMARLSHPNVMTVHAVGIVGDRLFIAMDLIEGGTLRDWLAEGPHAIEDVMARFVAAGRGLAHAHAHGIVHRDFKPDNVLVGADGRVVVTDFGLAQAPSRAEASPSALAVTEPDLSRLTRTGVFVGTPAYMAPEQFSGRDCDARSDQFSFCIALWEALYGVRPFAGRSVEELALAVKTGAIRSPPPGRTIPDRIDRAIRRGLATDREARWPDMPSLLAALAPRRSRPSRTLAIAAAASVAAGVGLHWATRADAVPKPCTAAADHLRGVWDEERRADVRDALLRSGTEFAEVAAREVTARFDEYASEWIAMHTEACNAALRGTEAPTLLDRRMACLDRRRAEIAATADVLARGDAISTENAIMTASSLPPLPACGNLDALQAEQPVPEDPVLAAAVAQQIDAMARISALTRAAAYEEAEAEVREVVDAATELDWPPLQAEALLYRGKLRRIRADFDGAYDDLLEAWSLARASGHDRVAARAATEQVVVATQRYALDDGSSWREHAFAAAERIGDDQLLAQAYSDAGMLSFNRGEYEEGIRFLTRAIELFERAPELDAVSVAEAAIRLGTLALTQQDLTTARAQFERGMSLLEASLGHDHPMLVAPLLDLGIVHYQLHELDEAERMMQRALAIHETSASGLHPDLITIVTNLGNVDTARGRFEDAQRHYRRAHEVALQLVGPDHVQVGIALVNVAMIEHELGDYEAARADYERTLDIWQREMPNHVALAYPLSGLGAALIELGRAEEARVHLERALELRNSTVSTPRDLADTERYLARALWDGGADRTRAIALARSARDRLLPIAEHVQDTLDEVEQWLAEHDR